MFKLLSDYVDFVFNNTIVGVVFTLVVIFSLVGIWQVAAAGWAKGKTLLARFLSAYAALKAAAQADVAKAEAFALAPFATEMHVTAESVENIGIEVENRIRKALGLANIPLVSVDPLTTSGPVLASTKPVPVLVVGEQAPAAPQPAPAPVVAAVADPVTGATVQSPAAGVAG